MASSLNDTQTIELSEHDRSAPLQLSEDVLDCIDAKINSSATRLKYEYTENGSVRLQTSSYVGLISLPGGIQVRIKPKAAGGNLLRLLLYAHGTTIATTDSTVEARQGDLFLDAIGSLFLDRLQQIIRRGLGKSYQTKQAREEYLRGRLDVHRQLSRGPAAGTTFEIEYEDLTHDTIENQTVLYATHLLARLVSTEALQSTLRQREQQLRREVTLRPIQAPGLDEIHLDRLNQYYEDILRLAKVIVQSAFVENLQTGTNETYGLLLNMNRLFERVIERAARDALSASSWRVEEQARIDGLVTGGTPKVEMYPDFVLRDQNGKIRLIGDAKWKTGRPVQSDIYQLTSYQLADDVPGLVLYPSQNGTIETEYQVDNRLPLHLRELPTGRMTSDFESFTDGLVNTLMSEFRQIVPHF